MYKTVASRRPLLSKTDTGQVSRSVTGKLSRKVINEVDGAAWSIVCQLSSRMERDPSDGACPLEGPRPAQVFVAFIVSFGGFRIERVMF